jgi:hypothetical protein
LRDAREFEPRALGPDRRTQVFERRKSRVQGLAGQALLLAAAVDLAQYELGPRALERRRQIVQKGQ